MSEDLGPRHAQVVRLRSLLTDRTARRDAGCFVAEGARCIDGVLDRSASLRAVYFDADATDRVQPVLERVRAARTPVYRLSAGLGGRISDTVTAQGIFAEVEGEFVGLDADVLHADRPVVVLVGLQDPGNVGTILRSAEASGVRCVVVAGDSVDPWNPKVVRSSAGSVAGLTLIDAPDPAKALAALADAGYTRVSTEARGGVTPDDADLARRIALVVGSEAHGLDPALSATCDVRVTIPMNAATESLNAGVATSVLLFEAARQRKWDYE